MAKSRGARNFLFVLGASLLNRLRLTFQLSTGFTHAPQVAVANQVKDGEKLAHAYRSGVGSSILSSDEKSLTDLLLGIFYDPNFRQVMGDAAAPFCVFPSALTGKDLITSRGIVVKKETNPIWTLYVDLLSLYKSADVILIPEWHLYRTRPEALIERLKSRAPPEGLSGDLLQKLNHLSNFLVTHPKTQIENVLLYSRGQEVPVSANSPLTVRHNEVIADAAEYQTLMENRPSALERARKLISGAEWGKAEPYFVQLMHAAYLVAVTGQTISRDQVRKLAPTDDQDIERLLNASRVHGAVFNSHHTAPKSLETAA